MTDRLDLPLRYRHQLEVLLREHVPEAEVWAYGSRVNGSSHEVSDLDVVLRGPNLERVGEGYLDLLGAIEESNIPFLVQVHDWAGLPENFHRDIERNHVVVQEVGVKQTAGGQSYIERPFADVIDFREGPGIMARDFRKQGIPLVRLSGLSDGASILDGCNYLEPEEVKRRWSQFRLALGDVLLSTSASLGRIAEVGQEGIGAIPYTGIIRMRPRDDSVYAPFIRYVLEGPDFQRQAEMVGAGSVIRHFGPTHLKNMTLRIPPLPQQRAIANVLGTLDDKIDLNRRMNQTLEQMARALFKSWFVAFDPVRAKMEGRWRPGQSLPGLPAHLYDLFPSRLAPSELGPIPEGWEIRTVGEIVTQLRDSENPSSSPNEVFSHFSIPAFDQGRVPKRESGANIKSAKTLLQPGVVLVSKLNPEIERVWLPDIGLSERAISSTEFLVFSPRPPIKRSYICCLALSRVFRAQIQSLVTGTSKSHQRAQAGAVLSLQTIVPSRSIIEVFDEQASILLDRSLGYLAETIALTTQRDTLLPKLVSGDLRVAID